ncbi:MAG: type II secretion system major pseudopilin GspG [Lentisphaeria bacterium]|nr:type II secretion system protein GspG [Lentisphaerota bacterium]MBR2626597.1 type II secretion system major pseudopilin GspG [Lentisphaeria bacterium]
MKKMQKKSRFTLIEVVIVIVILVTLASIATPMYMNYVSQANIGAAKTQLKNLSDAINGYRVDNKAYPPEESGLEALVSNVDDLETWKGPYIQGVLPKDPWGNDYIYRCPGEDDRPFEVISYGADGEPGGEDENADLSSWE